MGAPAVDQLAALGGVLGGDQCLDRRPILAAPAGAVGAGELDRLQQQVEVLGGIVAERLQVERFQDLEAFEVLEPERLRRRRPDRLATIRDLQRLGPLRRERREVLRLAQNWLGGRLSETLSEPSMAPLLGELKEREVNPFEVAEALARQTATRIQSRG